MRRWYILGPLGGIAVGLAALALGVQGWRPLLMGVVGGGFIMWSRRFWPEGMYAPWPRASRQVYSGGSHQVSRLSASINQRARSASTPDPGLQLRLRRLATARLRRMGVPWDDPRTPDVLGQEVYEALTTDTFTPDIRSVDVIVTAIERLDKGGTVR